MQRYARLSSIILTIFLIASFIFAFPTASLEAAAKPKLAGDSALTTEALKAKYAAAQAGGDKVRILVVPGHEPMYGGAQYAGYYERELVVPLSEKLAAELRKDPNLEVIVARDQSDWNSTFDRYFDRNMKTIKKFVESHKKEMKKLLRRGKVDENEEQAGHNAAPTDVAYRLYGITKWSNENDIDLMIHVHLNDAGDRRGDAPGAYTGLSIYVPYDEYGNSEASIDVAKEVFDRLTDITAKSTLALEDKGIVEDAELIALGSHNTSAVPSILIEYGYIYEPKFTDIAVQPAVFSDYAYQTARGVRDFFGVSNGGTYNTTALPYTWKSDVAVLPFASREGSTTPIVTGSVALYALQHALAKEGFYPMRPSTLINCPIDGRMSACVTEALTAYQTAHSLPASGTLDVATRNALNQTYGAGVYVPETAPVAPAVTVTPAATVTSSAACVPFTMSLELESTDAATKGQVSQLQRILAKDKTLYPEGKVTGYFGPATDKAVKAFQVKQGIAKPGSTGYGVVGPTTGKALFAACK